MRLLAGVVIAALIAAAAVFGWNYEYGTERTVTFTVKSLDDQSQGSQGHKYLVFAQDGQVYENTDSIFHGKTDSSRIQAWLTPGRTYRCPAFGKRVFWLSSYQDLLGGCTEVTR